VKKISDAIYVKNSTTTDNETLRVYINHGKEYSILSPETARVLARALDTHANQCDAANKAISLVIEVDTAAEQADAQAV